MSTGGTAALRAGGAGADEVDVTVTVLDGGGRGGDVRVRCAASSSVGELAQALVAAGVRGARECELYVGQRRLDPGSAVGTSVLHGAVLRAAPAPPAEPSLRELRVVGGRGAGTCHPLRPGATVVGRSGQADLRLDDERVSRAHVRVVVDEGGVTVADVGSTNGSTLDGRVVPTGGSGWPEGARLRLGDTVLEVGRPDPPPAAPVAVGGRLPVAAAPRLRAPAPAAEVRFPEPPPPPRQSRVPVAAALAPLAVGVVTALVLRSPTFLLLALLSPVVVAASASSERAHARREEREARHRHRAAVRAARAQVARALAAESAHRHVEDIDCAAALRLAVGRGARLWERRPGDSDVLRVRLGTADLPARVRVVGAPAAVCTGVPLGVDLPATGALGAAGSRPDVLAVGRAALGHAAVLHPPTLLDVVVISAWPGDWAWSRWLPHRRPEADPSAGTTRLEQLLAEVDRVRGRQDGPAERGGTPLARTLVVVDDPALREHPALGALAARGPAAGVHLLCLAADVDDLPPACSAVLADAGADGWVLRQDGQPPVTGVCPDAPPDAWAEAVARALAPLRPAAAGAASALPTAVAWRDLEGLRLTGAPADVGQVLMRWSRPGARPEVTIGATLTGPLPVDLGRAGPHVLVAGTTGSGKSELLQTLVAGLALAEPPESLQLLLVDYKGGAALGRCVDLPHTAGVVTDLDPALTRRALASLSAELRRREALLLTAEVPDLDTYRDRQAAGVVLPALPRLVLVVDEFATLVEELPDFVRGLVAVAQRGRSLGVHLVLATQRPEGSVSQDIRANTALRLCLAVAREAESRDVLDAPDAAWISRDRPGRAYLRRGAEGLVALQAARVTVPAARRGDEDRPLRVDVLAPARAGGRPPEHAPESRPADGPTDLDLLVAACTTAAQQRAVPLPPCPWLPPLPGRLLLADLPVQPHAETEPGAALVPFGLQDVPHEQGRRVLSLDLRGNLAVVGGPRSGRTTTLVTLAGAAATTSDPGRLHLVGLDFGGTALRALERLPHCGAVVTGDEPERLVRLLTALTREITRRRAAGGGRRTAPGPHLLVLLDQWDAFVAGNADVDGGRLVDALTRVLREGPAVGVTSVVTSDRTVLVGRVAGLLPQRLLLRLPDPGDYAAAGVSPRDVPADLPPGRGLHSSGLLTQVAVLGADPALTPDELLAGLDVPSARPGDPDPLRVDPLPTRVTTEGVEELRAAPRPVGCSLTPGVGGDRLAPLDVDLDDAGPVFLVAGPPRAGRSTALLTCLLSLLRAPSAGPRGAATAPTRVVVIAPRPGPLRTPPDLGVPVTVVTDPGPDVRDLVTAAPVLVVDDAEHVTDPAAAAALDEAVVTARDRGAVVLVAGATGALLTCYRRWADEARRGRTGLLLAPESSTDGDLFGCRLPRSAGGEVAPPGRGLLVVRGVPVAVQVALPQPTRAVAREGRAHPDGPAPAEQTHRVGPRVRSAA